MGHFWGQAALGIQNFQVLDNHMHLPHGTLAMGSGWPPRIKYGDCVVKRVFTQNTISDLNSRSGSAASGTREVSGFRAFGETFSER